MPGITIIDYRDDIPSQAITAIRVAAWQVSHKTVLITYHTTISDGLEPLGELMGAVPTVTSDILDIGSGKTLLTLNIGTLKHPQFCSIHTSIYPIS